MTLFGLWGWDLTGSVFDTASAWRPSLVSKIGEQGEVVKRVVGWSDLVVAATEAQNSHLRAIESWQPSLITCRAKKR